jgi:hypothetical protein
MNKSPYDGTLCIDADKFILGDLKQVFSLLHRFELIYQPSAPCDHYELSGMPMHSFDERSAGIVAW